MTSSRLSREILKAAALGDAGTVEQLNEERLSKDRSEDERRQFRTLVSALFCIVLERRFRDDASHAAVKRFIDEMRYDYRNAEPPIKPLVTEGLIRGVMGEEHLLDEIAPEEQLEAQFPVIRKITMQSEDMTNRIDAYLTDAEALAAQRVSER
ncbi:MAG: hypothetical protein ACRDXX_09905 [Stackebrandtia sp.]